VPDLLAFQVVRNGTVSLPNAPTWKVSGQIVDSTDQTKVLADFTGGNAVNFPQVLGQLTAAQMDAFVNDAIMDILSKRFGLF
jgi:hypothetical protein